MSESRKSGHPFATSRVKGAPKLLALLIEFLQELATGKACESGKPYNGFFNPDNVPKSELDALGTVLDAFAQAERNLRTELAKSDPTERIKGKAKELGFVPLMLDPKLSELCAEQIEKGMDRLVKFGAKHGADAQRVRAIVADYKKELANAYAKKGKK